MCLLYAWHCSKCLMYINSFTLHKSPVNWLLLLSHFTDDESQVQRHQELAWGYTAAEWQMLQSSSNHFAKLPSNPFAPQTRALILEPFLALQLTSDMVMSKLFNFSGLYNLFQFWSGKNDSTILTEFIHGKHLKQCLALNPPHTHTQNNWDFIVYYVANWSHTASCWWLIVSDFWKKTVLAYIYIFFAFLWRMGLGCHFLWKWERGGQRCFW